MHTDIYSWMSGQADVHMSSLSLSVCLSLSLSPRPLSLTHTHTHSHFVYFVVDVSVWLRQPLCIHNNVKLPGIMSVLSEMKSFVLMWLSPLGCSTGLVFCFSCITHVHWHGKSLWNLTLAIFVPLNIERTVPYMVGVGGGFRFPCELVRSAICSCCCF